MTFLCDGRAQSLKIVSNEISKDLGSMSKVTEHIQKEWFLKVLMVNRIRVFVFRIVLWISFKFEVRFWSAASVEHGSGGRSGSAGCSSA